MDDQCDQNPECKVQIISQNLDASSGTDTWFNRLELMIKQEKAIEIAMKIITYQKLRVFLGDTISIPRKKKFLYQDSEVTVKKRTQAVECMQRSAQKERFVLT
jgi:hypothetical protein